MSTDHLERKQRIDAEAETAFKLWLSRPETRMILSLVPATDHNDAFQLLLRSAFDAGNNCGQGSVLMEITKQLFKEKEQGRR